MAVGLTPAVFLDKDGTLIEDVPYNVNPQLVRLVAGAGQALWKLKKAGYKLIVISNQSGVARGLFQQSALLQVSEKIQQLLAPFGVMIDDFYYCPHGSNDACECRKPKPGLIQRAVNEHGIDPKRSWMIGDILHDVEAGNRAGCHTIHVDNGSETEWQPGEYRQPDKTAGSLREAAEIIRNQSPERRRYEQQISYHY